MTRRPTRRILLSVLALCQGPSCAGGESDTSVPPGEDRQGPLQVTDPACVPGACTCRGEVDSTARLNETGPSPEALRSGVPCIVAASPGRGDADAAGRETAHLVVKRTRWPGLERSLDYPALGLANARGVPREEHMISTLATVLLRGERVFAEVGASHVVMQEPALRSLVGPAC